MKLKDYLKCDGCKQEFYEAYEWQQLGYDTGLEFNEGHLSFFVLNKRGGFIGE